MKQKEELDMKQKEDEVSSEQDIERGKSLDDQQILPIKPYDPTV